ncbi:hypothetical protein [Desulfopila aestuarii]|uniref:Uncharacterized protein n=1 Tax=Desulfopila aestuarii DSM 18488 TaxID=1121416 RepID=A0A1M7Y8L2_9BACT|nr:hypothetical protein [Desulfopila aestuarii]SHO48973.1 hypothetical protein SAMN02745220_02574 [Desulfopila aestuarii DSM 18488]
MKISSLHVFLVLITAFGLIACVPAKSIQELNPGVTFMGKSEVTEFLNGARLDGPNAIVTYNESGTATFNRKKDGKIVNASWKVADDGKVTVLRPGKTDYYYFSTDNKTIYMPNGSVVSYTKL